MSAEFLHSDVAVSGQVLVAMAVVWRLIANTLVSRKRRKANLEKRVTSFSDAAGTYLCTHTHIHMYADT
jgi:hypothetical protein